ncbi:DNA adenine methylase [Planobispora rosea]|nr:DNA adenine methylase [Planobispora rosea]
MHQAPFPYYGAKGRLAPWILSHMPEHAIYVEPFIGSGAVLLAKAPARTEVINDLNGDVVNFWRVLRDRYDELVGALQFTPYARDEYLFCRDGRAGPTDDVERARQFFARCCMAFNASTGRVGFSPSGLGKLGKASTFRRRIDGRLEQVAERIREVEIENMNALELIRRWRDPQAVLYLDPPYVNGTRSSTSDYATDNGSEEFHQALMDTIADHRGTVMLSGYIGSPYDCLGWRREEIQVPAHVSNRIGTKRTECLWINR